MTEKRLRKIARWAKKEGISIQAALKIWKENI